ncbi:hypothetical protein BC937DRAFT_88180 [Endogone sp. FLAS-F59071]|nr:hypothetical protein BC937DRAFT_88180 [Endogone sp. FLAS-F59071]|eukprot:RUS18908.1 hypothetical protein BC937DRAFT_88180 [Endogone sp. FLAS-F59071]
MDQLFRECREQFENKDLQLEDTVKLGACFLARFLWKWKNRIGCFQNLQLHKKSHGVLKLCTPGDVPSMLATLIVERVHKSICFN